MAAVDATTKEMEALHVGQNDETKVSSCSSSVVFHGPWSESIVLLCTQLSIFFFGIYLRIVGVFRLRRWSSHDNWVIDLHTHMFNAILASSFVPYFNYALSEVTCK